VHVRGVRRRFGQKDALLPFDLDVPKGSITGLIGPNGSGKSTLLRCIVGLVRPDAGEVAVDGVTLRGDGVAIRRRCTYAPGELALYGELRGAQHLAWLLRGREPASLERARATAERLRLPLERRVREYRHGMKRQLLFAAALAPDVPVRILDEITEGLDPEKRGIVIDLLRADVRDGGTVLLSSHHLGEIDRACDQLVFVNDGAKLSEETAAGVAARARRVVHLGFVPGTPLEPVERAAAALPGVSARIVCDGLRRALDDDDPRPALAALFARTELSRPSVIRYGELSLPELYEELYGVRAC
jgi:ABC-2 type transport system ATP-binding protein